MYNLMTIIYSFVLCSSILFAKRVEFKCSYQR